MPRCTGYVFPVPESPETSLHKAIDLLKLLREYSAVPKRRIDVLIKVVVEGYTLKEVGAEYGWSKTRVGRAVCVTLRQLWQLSQRLDQPHSTYKERRLQRQLRQVDRIVAEDKERRDKERRDKELEVHKEESSVAPVSAVDAEYERRLRNRRYLERYTDYHPDCFAITSYGPECDGCKNAALCRLASDVKYVW